MSNILYTLRRGEKFPIEVTLTNQDESTPIDLTDATIRVILKDEPSDTTKIFEKEITTTSDIDTVGQITDATNGKFVIRINDTDFSKIVDERIYQMTIFWEIESENFAKVVSSNCGEYLLFKVCAV